MPIAIALGAATPIVFASPQKLAQDLDEFAVAGALAGAPVELVKCKTVPLEVPARAEIVIEGWIEADLLEPEAPFGESNGYVALEAFNMPMQVTAITHRKHAVFNAIISQVTPSESSVIKKVAYEPLYLRHLKSHLGVKGVLRVVMHEPLTNLRPVIFVQFKYGTPKTEVWRALHGTSSFVAGQGKICIAVSDDVDPSSVDAVLWSIAYRSNPLEDAIMLPFRRGVQGAQYGANQTDSSLLIDATRKSLMPPLALPAREFMEGARKLWDELGLPALKTPSPWHGYTLGKWSDTWERFAQRAVKGEWEANGLETLARQRKGLEAETSVTKVGK
jgi:UbiD family decarboxylase